MNKTICLVVAVVAAAVFTGTAIAEELTAQEQEIYAEVKAAREDSIFYGAAGDLSGPEVQGRLDTIRNKYGISDSDIGGIQSKAADRMTDKEMTICEEVIVELAREQVKPGCTRESIDRVLGEMAAKYGISVQELKDMVYKFAMS